MLDTKKIKQIMKTFLFTQEEFAKKIGISTNGYSLALKRGYIDSRYVEKMAIVLKININELFKPDRKTQTNVVAEDDVPYITKKMQQNKEGKEELVAIIKEKNNIIAEKNKVIKQLKSKSDE